jgi:hypothetical protein
MGSEMDYLGAVEPGDGSRLLAEQQAALRCVATLVAEGVTNAARRARVDRTSAEISRRLTPRRTQMGRPPRQLVHVLPRAIRSGCWVKDHLHPASDPRSR